MTRRLARVAVGLGFSLVALSRGVAAQGAAGADPWTRVPPLPTSCYGGDDFEARMRAVGDSNNAALTRQDELNARIKSRFDSMDMSERMQRMQEFMMKNPQQAAQVMQAMQAMGASAAAEATTTQADLQALEQQFTADTTRYRAAVRGVRDPIQRQIDDLVKTKGKVADEAGGIALPAADIPRYRALIAQLDTDYERICGAWWGPTGTFPKWVSRYKDYVLRYVVAQQQKADDGTLQVLQMLGLPSTGFRTTANLKGVRDYVLKVPQVYWLRAAHAVVGTPVAR